VSERARRSGRLFGGGVGTGATGGAAPGTPTGAMLVPASALVLLSMLVFGFVGLFRGVRRELVALFLIGGAYWLFNNRWTLLRRLYEPLVSRGFSELTVQLAAFLAVVAFAYVVSRRVTRAPKASGFDLLRDIPSLLERLMGAATGAANGFLVARFVTDRLFATASTAVIVPGPQTETFIDQQGTNLFWLIVAVVMLFGVMSLTPRKKSTS
jgi:hypothetical protein